VSYDAQAYPPGAYLPGQSPPAAYPPGWPTSAAPAGGALPSITTQLRLAELEANPAQYALPRRSGRRVILVATAVSLLVGGAGLAVLMGRGGDAPARATLVVESVPAGAAVTVDGSALPEVTPARFVTRPGERHEVRVTTPGHRPWSQAVVVPGGGGDVKVVAVLTKNTVQLRVESQPSGAEIWIDGAMRGRTPKVVEDLDPARSGRVELRMKGRSPEVRTLDWSSKERLDLVVKFARQ
jgi:hypothetical protein